MTVKKSKNDSKRRRQGVVTTGSNVGGNKRRNQWKNVCSALASAAILFLHSSTSFLGR
jgi:hypothetical protein